MGKEKEKSVQSRIPVAHKLRRGVLSKDVHYRCSRQGLPWDASVKLARCHIIDLVDISEQWSPKLGEPWLIRPRDTLFQPRESSHIAPGHQVHSYRPNEAEAFNIEPPSLVLYYKK